MNHGRLEANKCLPNNSTFLEPIRSQKGNYLETLDVSQVLCLSWNVSSKEEIEDPFLLEPWKILFSTTRLGRGYVASHQVPTMVSWLPFAQSRCQQQCACPNQKSKLISWANQGDVMMPWKKHVVVYLLNC